MGIVHITTEAIVLKERPIDDFDSILTLLTKKLGVISAYARGVRKPRSANRANVELLSYSCFVLFSNRGSYTVDKADLIKLFMGVRSDVEKLSLAAYFCQLTAEAAPHEEPAEAQVSLFMNTLYLLDTNKRSCEFVKPVYELRFLMMSGFMPDLVGCGTCGEYEAKQMWFLPQTGELICGDCSTQLSDNILRILLPNGVLAAMRYILYIKSEKLFAFTLPESALKILGEITQTYTIFQLDRKFDALDFYEKIRI